MLHLICEYHLYIERGDFHPRIAISPALNLLIHGKDTALDSLTKPTLIFHNQDE